MSPIGLARLCENMRARETRRIVFSIVFSRLLSSAFFGKRLFRNIEDGDDLKTLIKKRFDPPRCAAADINNRRGSFDARCMNEIEGDG